MDQCEALGAAYGVPPRVVLHWPMVHVEELWISYLKRLGRTMKMDAMTKGLGALGAGASVSSSTGPTTRVLPEWPTESNPNDIKPKTWYGNQQVYERPPTDEDNWDIPPTEVFKLAAMFPGAVKVVKT